MQEQADTLQANAGSIVGVDDNDAGVQEAKETAVIAVCAGKGIENAF